MLPDLGLLSLVARVSVEGGDQHPLSTGGAKTRIDGVSHARSRRRREVVDEPLRNPRGSHDGIGVPFVQEDEVQVGGVGELAARQLPHGQDREAPLRTVRRSGLGCREGALDHGLGQEREKARHLLERHDAGQIQAGGEGALVSDEQPRLIQKLLEIVAVRIRSRFGKLLSSTFQARRVRIGQPLGEARPKREVAGHLAARSKHARKPAHRRLAKACLRELRGTTLQEGRACQGKAFGQARPLESLLEPDLHGGAHGVSPAWVLRRRTSASKCERTSARVLVHSSSSRLRAAAASSSR